MPQTIDLRLPPEAAQDHRELRIAVAGHLRLRPEQIAATQIVRQSIDARKRPVLMQLRIVVFRTGERYEDAFHFEPTLRSVEGRQPVYIAGAGPAGLFAALRCIELGYRPIILERGKDVRARRRDLAAMHREGKVHPDSNYCYGEGGAGTYSDGKLYTRSGKRGSIQQVLQWFHYFGAADDILYTAHPHIGTNKLPGIVRSMREAIVAAGGEVHFDTKLVDIQIMDGAVSGITLQGGIRLSCRHLILATGHSARDIFALLQQRGVALEAKPYALGVRVEHPQALINKLQYHCGPSDPIIGLLGAASYSLVSQEQGRGVFSFCMCPGGIIAPASTEDGALVVNGWSPSKRNGLYANSGMVVSVDERDFAAAGFHGPLAGMQYQQMVEEKAWLAGGGALVAPAQRLIDFVQQKPSRGLPACSYQPGIAAADMAAVLPAKVAAALRSGFQSFGKKMKGYLTNEAVILATESRTSSPIRIPRDGLSLEHSSISGLYPCAEGAGYAGGIVSAAIDGMRVADAVAMSIKV